MSLGEIPAATDGRKGRVFSLRLKPEEETRFREMMAEHERERHQAPDHDYSRQWNSLGAWIIWAALQWRPAGRLEAGKTKRARRGKTKSRSRARSTKPHGKKKSKRQGKKK